MKRCPECGREYDASMMFCLDDGAELLYGPASDEPATAIISSPHITSDDPTRSFRSSDIPAGSIPSLPQTQRRSKTKIYFVVAAAAVLLLVGGIFGYRHYSSAGSGQIESIAVMPFVNASGNADSEYLSDGLAESLIYRLSQLPDLKVSPASTVMRYKGREFDAQKIAAELGVQAVMSGRMNQRGDNLSISIELIDAANNKVIWGEQYERKMADLIATQREIATAIVDKLQLKLSGTETAGITKKYTDSSEAYQLYLKGRFQWNKRTVEGLKAAEGFYKQAIESDPSFALAYSALAETYVLFPNYSVESPKESSPKAKAAATKAVELDPTLAEPHAALGLYHSIYTWDLEAAERELRRAAELNPKYATAPHWLGTILPMAGKCDEAIAMAKRAEDLDPLSVIISADVAYDLVLCRRYDDALAQTEKTLKLDPNFYYTHYVAGWAHSMKGTHAQALASFRRSRELNTDPYATMLFIQALVRAGERIEAAKLRDELRSTPNREAIDPYIFALAEAALGDKDAAFALLEKTLTERGVYAPSLAFDPNADELTSDPRFEVLMKKIRSSRLE
jgi:TolB-like protein/Flp pilus assembly protein TadD